MAEVIPFEENMFENQESSASSRLGLLWSKYKVPILGFVGIAIAEAVYIFMIEKVFYDKLERANSFGGYHGMLNTMFTGLAVLGTYYVFHEQQKMVERQERRQARHESEQLFANEKIERAQRRDKFEQRLFQQLEVHRDLVDDLRFVVHRGVNSYPKDNRDALNSLYSEIWVRFCNLNSPACVIPEGDKQGRVLKLNDSVVSVVFTALYEKCEDSFGAYFRSLYYIFKYIDQSDDISEADKVEYAELIRARLSSNEVALLMFNGTTPRGAKFVRLINKYALLKHLPSKIVVVEKGVFDASAFGGRLGRQAE